MNTKHRAVLLMAIVAVCLALAGSVLALSSDNFKLPWGAASSGGGLRSSSQFRLSDTLGQPVTGKTESGEFALESGNGPVFVAPSPLLGTIEGTVHLQGRANHAGARVSFAGYEALSDASGHFGIVAAPGTYEVRVAMSGYLSTLVEGVLVAEGSITGLQSLFLLGGDVTGDGKIDIFDLTVVAANFNTGSPDADINGDGEANIFDLVLVGMNFGRGTTPDGAPPTTVAISNPSPNTNGWNNSSVTITLDADDNPSGSGVVQIHFRVDGGADQFVPGDTLIVNIEAEGEHTLAFYAVDNSGNAESENLLMVKVDKTVPTITATRSPQPNINGWNNSDVTVVFEASDGMSGIDTVSPPAITSTEGLDQFATGTASDRAGNTASTTVSGIKLDKSHPIIQVLSPTPRTYLPGELVLIDYEVTDLLSGLAGHSADLGGMSVSDGAMVTLPGYSGQIMFTVHAEDRAGNEADTSMPLQVTGSEPGGTPGPPPPPGGIFPQAKEAFDPRTQG